MGVYREVENANPTHSYAVTGTANMRTLDWQKKRFSQVHDIYYQPVSLTGIELAKT